MFTNRVVLWAAIGLSIVIPNVAAADQWDPREAALSRCEQELKFQMARESNARQPDALVDERRVQYDCLDVEGAKRVDGANIQMWSCSGGANQTWLLRK